MQKSELIELWEIAVFIRQQLPATQNKIRALHRKSELEAIFRVRREMEKMGYFK